MIHRLEPEGDGCTFYSESYFGMKVPVIGFLFYWLILPFLYSRTSGENWIGDKIEETGRTEDAVGDCLTLMPSNVRFGRGIRSLLGAKRSFSRASSRLGLLDGRHLRPDPWTEHAIAARQEAVTVDLCGRSEDRVVQSMTRKAGLEFRREQARTHCNCRIHRKDAIAELGG